MTRVFGVIGYPIHHSLSPLMHNAAFRALGLDAIYAPFEVPPRQAGLVLRGLQRCGIDGLNITVPHKERLLRYLKPRRDVERSAAMVGAVNTLVRADGRFRGYNTDVVGFQHTLHRELGLDCANKRLLVLGAGGAARAVVWALLSSRPAVICVANRTLAKARALVRRLRRVAGATPMVAMSLRRRDITPLLGDTDLLVNATSLGLRAGDPLPVDPTGLHKRMAVVDLVYRSPTTALVQAARRRGALAIDGVPMLVYQGAESFRLWWHRRPPVEVMRNAVEQALRKRSPQPS